MWWIHVQSEWDQKMGKIQCVFSLYDKMRWKWDVVYLPRGLRNTFSVSLIPPPLPRYLRTPTIAHSTSVTPVSAYTHRRSLTIYLESVINQVWRCTGRPWSSEFGDALGGRDGVNSEMHLEAEIDWVWRCTGRPRCSELRDALGGRDRLSLEMHWGPRCSELRDALGGRDQASLEMHWEAKMKWTQRCTWRPWSIEFGDALGACDRASLEMHLQAMIERDWGSTWRRSIWREVRRQLILYSFVNL